MPPENTHKTRWHWYQVQNTNYATQNTIFDYIYAINLDASCVVVIDGVIVVVNVGSIVITASVGVFVGSVTTACVNVFVGSVATTGVVLYFW